MIKTVIYLALLLTLYSVNVAADTPSDETLTLTTTPWCPYTCSDKHEFGAVGAYMSTIFRSLNIDITIESYPWSRAIKQVNTGAADGLLTATQQEAPGLLFTTPPISTYQMCFFSKQENTWLFKEPINLNNNKLGIIQGYGYGEPLDTYIADHPNIFQITGHDTTERLINFLLKDRVDIIVEDESVLRWVANRKEIDLSFLKKVGCLAKNPFFLALSPTEEHREIIEKLNKALREPNNVALIKQLLTSEN